MVDWKADLDMLVEETMAFANSVRVGPPLPRAVVPSVSWMKSEREEIMHRVANFKAHQLRFIREREDFAASEFRRMLASRQ